VAKEANAPIEAKATKDASTIQVNIPIAAYIRSQILLSVSDE
jgi:hypothetical protein